MGPSPLFKEPRNPVRNAPYHFCRARPLLNELSPHVRGTDCQGS